jgi:hypothetical protein
LIDADAGEASSFASTPVTPLGFVVDTARWQCPDCVAMLKVADLKLSLPLALVSRKGNVSPLLSRFVTDGWSLVKDEAEERT